MGEGGTLKVLLWKHFMVRKRRYVHTIIELSSPLFLFLIFFLLRNMIHPVMKSQAEEKLYEIHRTETKPLSNPTVRLPYTILYSPDTEHTQRIMEVVGEKLRLPKLTQFPGTRTRGYYGFSNDTNIVDFVKEMDESQAIVLFQDMEEKWPRHLNYTIRMKIDFMTQLYHSYDLGVSHERFGTIYDGFMLLQWTIDSSYLYLMTGENVNQTVSLQEFPYAESAQNAVMEQVVILLQLACYGSLAIPFVFLMSRLLTERTSGVQELMKLAGVSVNMLGLSHFLNVLPTGLVYSVGGAIFVKVSSNPLVPESNGFLIFLTLLLHFVTVMAMAFVFSYILKSTQYAVSVSSLVYVVSRVISSLLDNPKLPKVALVPAAIMPHMPMYWFWGEVGALEVYGGAVSFSTMASSHSQPGVSVLACYALMVLQASLLFLFAWYLSLVRPGNYGVARPWNFCFKKRVTPDKLTDEAEEEPITRDNRFFEKIPSNADVGIQISNVTKVFDKQVALSNVSFDVLRGEITVLLGHNGAGKTTLMSIITGMYSANEGSILVGGNEVSRGGAKARLGLCPQHNLFFPDLTVMEHVIFFSMLKGQTYSQAQNSGKALLKKLGIGDKANAQSGQLSGGMKRRLQLACALAGDADVLVLDEPTSGLDVETRRELWDLLLSLRGSRTLLLSTHFMEEADALGDRVAALHQGRLRCHATPLYLKKNIGTGYRLTLTTIGLPKEDPISTLVTSHVPDATLKEKSLNTISFSLPAASSSKFPELFAQLEEKRSEMGVDSIGVGVSTLEEVFLKLCSNVDTTFTDDAVDSSVPEATYNRHTGLLLVVQQMLILMKRQIQFLMFKKWHFSIMQVILPVALVFVFTHLTNEVQNQQYQSNTKVSLDLDLYRDMPDRRVYYHVSKDRPLRSLADTYPDVEFQVTNDVGEAVLRVSQTDMLEYNKYLAGVEINDTDAKVLYTTRVRHAAPVALNLLSNMLAAQLIPWADGRTFTTNNYPLQGAFVLQDKAYVQTKSTSGAAMWVFFVVFLILGAVMNAVSLPCSERQSGARHLHVMAGCAAGTHWTATLLLHCSLYVAVLVLPTMLAAGVVDRDGLFTQSGFLGSLLVSLTLGIAAFLALSYLVSFFVGERGAGAVLFVIILVLGVIPALVKTGADLLNEDIGRWKFPLALLNYVVPPNALTVALLRSVHVASSNAVCSLNRDHCPNLNLAAEEIVKCCDQNQNPRCYFCTESYAPSMDWIILVFQLIFYMTLVLCAQHGFFHWLWDRATNMNYHPTAHSNSDEMVRAETTYVSKAITLPNKQVPDAMLVNDVHKRYPSIFRKTCNAVKGISFSVKKGECFGVLGVNGAGKSTTFKMITAEECTTRGSVFANGHHLKYPRAKYLESLGYCPQFFGLDDFLTGRDNLTLLLTLRGLPMDHVAQQVKSWIAVVGLEKYAGLPVEGYSGGCKRRLAAAAALCGGAPVTLLDEPTAGVDVAARRRVWAALRRGLAAGRALIITSHSMDEMEALCARIAIVSRGEMAALGSAAALRAAHASGHAVVLKIAAPTLHGDVTDGGEPEVQNLKAKLHEKFNCSLKDEHKTMLHYHINETMRYSDIFKGLEQLKAMYPDLIEDYSVTETTLEEVFLSFANDAQTPENPVARV